MVLEGDVYEIPEEQELFSLKKLANARMRGNTGPKKLLKSNKKKDDDEDGRSSGVDTGEGEDDDVDG